MLHMCCVVCRQSYEGDDAPAHLRNVHKSTFTSVRTALAAPAGGRSPFVFWRETLPIRYREAAVMPTPECQTKPDYSLGGEYAVRCGSAQYTL